MPEKQPVSVRQVAVIEIGSSTIRLTIGELSEQGGVRIVEALDQAVSLGKDTFNHGVIRKVTIEECISVVKRYRTVLEQYGIVRDDQLRTVATTAVREASNRNAFIERINIATGLTVETLDESDVVRLTYQSARSFFSTHPAPGENLLITEMGGGSTELMAFKDGAVSLYQTYRLGALRMREAFESIKTPLIRQRRLLEEHIRQTIDDIRKNQALSEIKVIIALGAEIRFAAAGLKPGWNPKDPLRLPLSALSRFCDEIIGQSVNELARRHHLPFPLVETIGPTLLYYVMLARAFGCKYIDCADISQRHGLLLEMNRSARINPDFGEQIVLSAVDTARRYHANEPHFQHVVKLCLVIFDALRDEHRLDPWSRQLLTVAAVLHDIGLFINQRNHHKHSLYLILNSDLFGLTRRDITLVACVARYHRRSAPKPDHAEYAALSLQERIIVVKLAAILRVADALDQSHIQRINDIHCQREGQTFALIASGTDDHSLEIMSLKAKSAMFEDVYGMSVILRNQSLEQ